MAKMDTNIAASHQPLRETTDSMSLPSQEMTDGIALDRLLRRNIDPDQISPFGAEITRNNVKIAQDQCFTFDPVALPCPAP
ncbi:MAG: hypothetical protein ACKOW1_07000 [Novosphingobium sp.]|jgi:hypothetical protein